MIKVTFLHNTNKPQNKSNGLLENRMRDLRYLCLFAHSGVQHILCFYLRLVYPLLPVSLDCPF